MKRSEELIPLARDHLHALNAAMLLRRADASNVPEAVASLSSFWDSRGRRHFEIEEELLVPDLLVADSEWSAAVEQIHEDHAEIRARIAALTDAEGADELRQANELGDVLDAHVRFEDREAFPLLESRAGATVMSELRLRVDAAEAR